MESKLDSAIQSHTTAIKSFHCICLACGRAHYAYKQTEVIPLLNGISAMNYQFRLLGKRTSEVVSVRLYSRVSVRKE